MESKTTRILGILPTDWEFRLSFLIRILHPFSSGYRSFTEPSNDLTLMENIVKKLRQVSWVILLLMIILATLLSFLIIISF